MGKKRGKIIENCKSNFEVEHRKRNVIFILYCFINSKRINFFSNFNLFFKFLMHFFRVCTVRAKHFLYIFPQRLYAIAYLRGG